MHIIIVTNLYPENGTEIGNLQYCSEVWLVSGIGIGGGVASTRVVPYPSTVTPISLALATGDDWGDSGD